MFYVKVNWYDSFKEKDITDHMFVLANNWSEAMQKVTNSFDCINSIEATEIGDNNCGIMCVPENMVTAIINENSY